MGFIDELSLPPWASELRPLQKVAIIQAVRAFDKYNVVVLEAPTGSGKTIIGEMIRQAIGGKALYICHSKGLQRQFLKDFPDSKVLMGRNNYPTKLFPEEFNALQQLSCADCLASKQEPQCQWCGYKRECPYEVAKKEAVAADLAVINSSYFLTEANGPAHMSGRGLAIWDECDTAEKDLMGYIEVTIPEYLQLGKPDKVTKPESWLQWVQDSLPKVDKERVKLRGKTADVKVLRRYKRVQQVYEDLNTISHELTAGDNEWIMQVVRGGRGGGTEQVQFKPVKVSHFGKDFVWRHADKWLMMSASVISARVMMDSLGYDGEFGFVSLPSSFPVDNRRIYPMPVANMTFKTKDAEFPKLLKKVRDIVTKHEGERILIHSVSYELTANIIAGIRDLVPPEKLVSYTGSGTREAALGRYMGTEGAVMVAPSMDRGVDLPGEACRVQVLVKVPFLSMGDKQVAQRVYTRGGREWYATEAIRTMVQMTGRGVRSDQDWCVTYVLDSQFVKLTKEHQALLPEWWRKAITWRTAG